MSESGTAQLREPSGIPSGYSLRRRIEGPDVAAFGRIEDQAALYYTQGPSPEDWLFPIMVCAAAPLAGELVATENRGGQTVDLGSPDAVAVYHDGVWAPGLGEAQRAVFGGSMFVYWNRSAAHSITVSAPEATFAVRGPKDVVVTPGVLATIGRSLLSGRYE